VRRAVEPLLEHRLRLGDYETRALELEGEGPPYLLFHGFSDSADTWRLVLDALAREGRSAIAFDLPGFGSASSLSKESVLSQLDDFADAAFEHTGDGAIAVGNSLGGCVAMRLAERTGDENLPVFNIVFGAGSMRAELVSGPVEVHAGEVLDLEVLPVVDPAAEALEGDA